MKSVLFPANFFEWPEIKNLLPDQKLIAAHLWCNRFSRPSGIFILPLSMFSVNLSLQEAAVAAALRDFEEKKLVVWDEKTGEIFFQSWFRFHKFSPVFLSQMFEDFEKIDSEKVKEIVAEKIEIQKFKKPDLRMTKPKLIKNKAEEVEKILNAIIWYHQNNSPEKIKDLIDFTKKEREMRIP